MNRNNFSFEHVSQTISPNGCSIHHHSYRKYTERVVYVRSLDLSFCIPQEQVGGGWVVDELDSRPHTKVTGQQRALKLEKKKRKESLENSNEPLYLTIRSTVGASTLGVDTKDSRLPDLMIFPCRVGPTPSGHQDQLLTLVRSILNHTLTYTPLEIIK